MILSNINHGFPLPFRIHEGVVRGFEFQMSHSKIASFYKIIRKEKINTELVRPSTQECVCDAPKFRVTCKQMVWFIQLLHAPKGPWTELHCLHYTYSTLQHVLAVPLKLSLSSFALNFFFHHHFSSFSFLFCIACFDSDFLVPSVSKSPTPPFPLIPSFSPKHYSISSWPLFSLSFSLLFHFFFQLKHPLCNLLKLLLSPVFSLSLSVSLISGFALHISERRNTNEGWNLNSHFWISEYSFLFTISVKFSLFGS